MGLVRGLAGTVLLAVLVGGCGGASDANGPRPEAAPDGPATSDDVVDLSSIPDAEDADGAGGHPDNTTATDDGPVTWGSWELAGEIEVGSDSMGDFTLAFDVTNIGEEKAWGRFNVRLTNQGEWVGSGFCTTYDAAPGKTTEALCTSSDDYSDDYTEITVWDAV